MTHGHVTKIEYEIFDFVSKGKITLLPLRSEKVNGCTFSFSLKKLPVAEHCGLPGGITIFIDKVPDRGTTDSEAPAGT